MALPDENKLQQYPVHMYVWSRPPSFIAIAQAKSVAQARELVLQEIGSGSDGSCPERDKAWAYVTANTPGIWHGPNAEFALTDSAELTEVEAYAESKEREIKSLLQRNEELERQLAQPIDMLLFCPVCGLQHVDAADERTPGWTNPPHKSHLCHGCGHIWRPSDRPTNGVVATKTHGERDGTPGPLFVYKRCKELERQLAQEQYAFNMLQHDYCEAQRVASTSTNQLSQNLMEAHAKLAASEAKVAELQRQYDSDSSLITTLRISSNNERNRADQYKSQVERLAEFIDELDDRSLNDLKEAVKQGGYFGDIHDAPDDCDTHIVVTRGEFRKIRQALQSAVVESTHQSVKCSYCGDTKEVPESSVAYMACPKCSGASHTPEVES